MKLRQNELVLQKQKSARVNSKAEMSSQIKLKQDFKSSLIKLVISANNSNKITKNLSTNKNHYQYFDQMKLLVK